MASDVVLCRALALRKDGEDPGVEGAKTMVYETTLSSGITRTKEFERKKLAAFAVNVGTKCGHGCMYCSSGALLRMHSSFREAGRSPFEHGYSIVDPNTPARVALDAQRMRRRGLVQLCTTVDAWSPEAQAHDLGPRCLEALLAESGWTVRILTKNAAVARDFDMIARHRDRVLIGMSITATLERSDLISVAEPNASPLADRIAALHEAHDRGLRTYAMLCPLLPGIANAPEQVDALVKLAAICGAEEVFAEPVNPRGPGLRQTQQALERHGYVREAAAVGEIRRSGVWSHYVAQLISDLQRSVRAQHDIDRLRILLYPFRLSEEAAARIRQDDAGVVWLAKR